MVMFPLFLAINHAHYLSNESLEFIIISYFVHLIGSIFFGLIIGLISCVLLKYSGSNKIWDTLETASIVIICYISFVLAEATGFAGAISLISTGLALVKYYFITDLSRIILSNSLISVNAVFEIIGYFILGFYLSSSTTTNIPVVVFSPLAILVSRLISVCSSYLLGKLLGLKLNGLKDIYSIWLLNIKGIEAFAVFIAISKDFDHGSEILDYGKFSIAFSVLVSSLVYKLFDQEKDQAYSSASRGCCLKLKRVIQLCDKNINDFFYKESQETSVLSPKFQDTPQRFEPGIQQRQDKDETMRELQALNMNVTETEILSAFQLR